MKKHTLIFLVALLAAAYVFAGGASEAEPAQEGEIGGTVSVLATWGGQELEVFKEMIKPWEEETGIKVEYEGTRDIDAILTTRVEAGNPPDIAILPGPGKMLEFGKAGKLVDLAAVLDMARIKEDYSEGWLELGTVDGKLVGIFPKAAIKGLIWYNPKSIEAAGISIPATWDELMATSKKLAGQGKTPWAIGLESGAASGWVGTDWLENIFLRINGPQKYKEWYEGKIPWTAPEVKKAWETWGEIVADEKMIYGGKQFVMATGFGQGHAPLFLDPPTAYFHQQASFIQGFIQDQFPGLKPVTDFMFFGFPPIKPEFAKAVEAAGDISIMFNDTPQAAQLLNYLATAQAQSYWASTGALAPNRKVALLFYPDELTRTSAQILKNSEIVVFDASDMMPGQMNTSFWSAVMSYVNNPGSLDSILAELEKVRQDVY